MTIGCIQFHRASPKHVGPAAREKYRAELRRIFFVALKGVVEGVLFWGYVWASKTYMYCVCSESCVLVQQCRKCSCCAWRCTVFVFGGRWKKMLAVPLSGRRKSYILSCCGVFVGSWEVVVAYCFPVGRRNVSLGNKKWFVGSDKNFGTDKTGTSGKIVAATKKGLAAIFPPIAYNSLEWLQPQHYWTTWKK